MTTDQKFNRIVKDIADDLLSSGHFEMKFHSGQDFVSGLEIEHKATLEYMYSIHKNDTLSFKWFTFFFLKNDENKIKFNDSQKIFIINFYDKASEMSINFWNDAREA